MTTSPRRQLHPPSSSTTVRSHYPSCPSTTAHRVSPLRAPRATSIGLCLVLVLAATWVPIVAARNVYVRAGATGRGSRDAPYGELWRAVERANRGDVIHVAAGTYYGKGGSGHYTITVPHLTLVGGYNEDFSERQPFQNLTILERAADYRGGYTGLPEGIIAGDHQTDHGNLIVDGFVLNGFSRNAYTADGTKINLRGSYKGRLFESNAENVRIRNCILLNPCGTGIYATWRGDDNEISNSVVANWLYSGIETRAAQEGSRILIRNNLVSFGWFKPGKGGAVGIFVGRQGQTVIENNVIAFINTEGGSAGVGVSNTFGNIDTVMRNNVFFSCSGGFYSYMDDNRANLLAWRQSDLDDLNDEDFCFDFMLDESGDNREADPGLKPDPTFAAIFANFTESEPGKLNMDLMNQWRRSVGLPLQAEPGTARENYAPAYPLDAVIPNLQSSIPGVGVQFDGPFENYSSQVEDEGPVSYVDVAVEDFRKGGSRASDNDGTAVQFQAGMGADKMVYEISQAPRSDYLCVELLKPGETPGMTRDFVHGYLLRGSKAHTDWQRMIRRRDNLNRAGGIWIQGRAWDFQNQAYNYPVGIVIDAVSRRKP